MDKRTLEKKVAELEKKRDKYFDLCQETGSPSSLKTYEKYDDLCDICYLALRYLSEEDEVRMRRMRNLNQFILSFKDEAALNSKDTYSQNDVALILEKVKNFL